MIPEPTPCEAFELVGDERTVELQKLQTPTGERLIVRGENAETRVDALALESLTWQDDSFFEALTADPHVEDHTVTDESDEIQISNEYTVVRVRKLETGAGPRVALSAPKLGYDCSLSPAELDAISDEQGDLFSELLETPLGPEDDHHGIH